MPVERVGQDAAKKHADRSAAGHDKAEEAHGPRPFTGLDEKVHDQRQGDRRDDRAAEPLNRTRRDQHALRTRQAAGAGGKSKKDYSGKEQPAMPEQIAEPAAKQQKATEGEDVGVHDPDKRRLGEAEIGTYGRQGDIHDRRVEDDHEVAEAENGEGKPGGMLQEIVRHGVSPSDESVLHRHDEREIRGSTFAPIFSAHLFLIVRPGADRLAGRF